MKITIAMIILALVYWNSKRPEKKKENTDPDYDDYLRKLCYISEKSAYDIFVIAAETIPKYIIDSGFKKYLRTGELPYYVEEFLEEGKEYIKETEVSPFTYWGGNLL